MIRVMAWLRSVRTRDRWALAAAACLVATFPALVVGGALGVFALEWWGVVSAFLGISWLVPGACAGAAATQWGKDRGSRHPNALGFTVGPIVTVTLLVLVAVILAAFWGEDLNEPQVERTPAVSDQAGRISLVTQATLDRGTRYGPAISIVCVKSDEGWCMVTYEAPACQLWVVENVDGVDKASPVDKTSEGGQGTYDEARDSVGCRWDVP
jgi:hypothetical protein